MGMSVGPKYYNQLYSFHPIIFRFPLISFKQRKTLTFCVQQVFPLTFSKTIFEKNKATIKITDFLFEI